MEKCYRITDASPVKQHFLEAEENKRVFFKRLDEFKSTHGITDAGALGNDLYLKNTRENEKQFGNQLTQKVTQDGYRKLKATSILAKEWRKRIEDLEGKTRNIPWAFMFKDVVGRHGYQAFEHQGEVYLHFAAYEVTFEDPEGFEEIQASEYHRVREAENALREAKRTSVA